MIEKLYKYLQILSIDVCLGACISCWMIAHYLEVSLSFWTYAVLACTVWLIYTADHLLDAYKISKQLKEKATTDRHIFHQHYFKPIVGVAFFCRIFCDLYPLPTSWNHCSKWIHPFRFCIDLLWGCQFIRTSKSSVQRA